MSEAFWIRYGTIPGQASPLWAGAKTHRGSLFELPAAARGGLNGASRTAFFEDVAALNARLGATSESLDLLGRVAREEADVLLTGQQPGFTGGPIYNVHKLATILVLARRGTSPGRRPLLPVFWGVTDDTDFGEISWTLLPGAQLAPRKIRAAAPPPGGRRMVGFLSRSLWRGGIDEIRGALPSDAPAGVDRWIDQLASLPGEDWGESFLALLLHLAGRRPLIVVDGRRTALLEAAEPLFERYLLKRREVASAVRDGARPFTEAGLAPPLAEEAGERSLFAVSGEERLPGDGEPGRRAPNVVLRPVLQSFLFPLRGVVLGASEIDYRIQMKGVYPLLGVDPPALLPRFHATLLPPMARAFATVEEAMEWLEDPDRARRRIESAARETNLVRLLAELRMALKAGLRALADLGRDEDRSYPQMTDSAETKILYQIQRLEEGLRGKIRSRRFRERPGLAHLHEFLSPRSGPQERALSALTPGLLYGPGAYDEVRRWAEAWAESWSGEGDWSQWVLGPARGGAGSRPPAEGEEP